MTAALERDRAAAARVSSWGLWFLSLIGMGAAFDGIADRDWPMVVALTLVTLLLALAAGHERQEMREATAQADLLDGSWMDEWLGAWR